jgi:hypothetical protein
MKTQKRENLLAFLAKNICLQSSDYQTLPLVVLVVFGILQVMLLCIYAVNRKPDTLGVCLPSIFALVAAVMMSVIKAGSSFSMELRMGVHMSIPRRMMVAAGVAGSLLETVLLVGEAALLNAGWVAIFGNYSPEARIVNCIPAWAWAMMLYMPTAMGMLGGSILLRFGRKGFWTLYALFMAACFLPQFFKSSIPAGSLDALLAMLPVAGPILAAVCVAVGTIMLWRIPISE